MLMSHIHMVMSLSDRTNLRQENKNENVLAALFLELKNVGRDGQKWGHSIFVGAPALRLSLSLPPPPHIPPVSGTSANAHTPTHLRTT